MDWFITLGMDVQRLEQMLLYDLFPRRGNNCMQYMRPCKHFGTCHLRDFDEYKQPEEDTIGYQFVYNLNEIVQDHLTRLSA